MRLLSWLSAVAAACSLLASASARNISEFTMEVRRSNVLRVSRQSCEECVTLEELFDVNRLVFLLFHERALVGQQRYKSAIVSGFHETCADLRFSHIVCGAVDMVDDKEFALKYIDPKTAPAHIIFRHGEPVVIAKKHIDRLMARPGDKETILWHLGDLLAADTSPLSFHISAEAKDAGTLGRLLQRHEATVVVAGASSANSVRSAAQRLVFQDIVPNSVDRRSRGGKGQASKPEPGRKPLFFVVASGAKTLKAYNLTEGEICAFVGKQRLPSARADIAKKLRGEDMVAAALLPIVSSVLEATGGGAAGQAFEAKAALEQPKSGAPSGKGKRRRRRRAQAGEL